MRCKKRGRLLVVFSIFFAIFMFQVQAEVLGCYTYPEADEATTYCVPNLLKDLAEQDCQNQEGCQDVNQYFVTNSNCQEITDQNNQQLCERILCDIDCQEHTRGKCTALGGSEVSEDEEDVLCEPGCCVVHQSAVDRQCLYPKLRKQCDLLKQNTGFDTDFYNPADMTLDSCNIEYCQEEIAKSNVEIKVKKVEGDNQIPLQANIQFIGTNLQPEDTNTEGILKKELNPGTYIVRASATGFRSTQEQISLSAGASEKLVLILEEAEAEVQISGEVTLKETNEPIPEATIIFKSVGQDDIQIETSANGEYVQKLIPGSYSVIISKLGKKTTTTDIVIFPNQDNQIFNFELSEQKEATVKGITYVDENNNDVADQGENRLTTVYIDGAFVGNSNIQDGIFEFEVDFTDENEQHKLVALQEGYTSEEHFFTFENLLIVDLGNVLLTTYSGICSFGKPDQNKNVEVFTANSIKGEEQVELVWEKPCQEVTGYEIIKTDVESDQISLISGASSPNLFKFIDNKVEWGKTYRYDIKAMYSDGGQPRKSDETNSVEITLGDKECEGKYDPSETFCRVEDRNLVFGCGDSEKGKLNFLVDSDDCSAIINNNFFCAQKSELTAICSNSAMCKQNGAPFGLYYTAETCYGVDSPLENKADIENFCYYDYTKKSTANRCEACTEISSCFNYLSEDACDINRCLSSIEDCKWVNSSANPSLVNYGDLLNGNNPLFISSETGSGYCVPQEKYEGNDDDLEADDQCALCSADATLFENFYCTADICSNLGRCYSSSELDFCNECGPTPTNEKSCKSYKTELECSNGENTAISEFAEFSSSKDSCNWERCSWTGTNCIKDGDGDSIDDCAGSPGVLNCLMDNKPPKTKIISEGLPIVSLVKPEITFEADDEFHKYPGQRNKPKSVYFCLTSAHEEAPDTCTKDKFVFADYTGVSSKQTTLANLIEFPDLGLTSVAGTTYRIKYFSKDIYLNQEELQEASVYIDNVPPNFRIGETINIVADTTELILFPESTGQPLEPMSCEFKIEQILPIGETRESSVGRDQNPKQAIFSDLKGIDYAVNVTCTDDHGNVHSEFKHEIFNYDPSIQIINPPFGGYISSTNVVFKINTDVGSTCELYRSQTNEKIQGGNFNTNQEGKVHQTNTIPISKLGDSIKVGEYANQYKVVCKELLSGEMHDNTYFHFFVDFEGPKTTIELREGKRPTERPTVYGWERSFISSAEINLICEEDGVACDQTMFCLGKNCGHINDPNYLEFTGTFSVNESTRICYYSTDIKSNQPSLVCGDIEIEGFRVILENPIGHTFNEQIWGISNEPVFDWDFLTNVPSQQCKFNFFPNFDFDSVESFKILDNVGGKYSFLNFPGDSINSFPEEGGSKQIFLQCVDGADTKFPETKVNLEYDPSPPKILEVKAEPSMVVEGKITKLTVKTDDKTLCKFSDNSEGEGSSEFKIMGLSFPGFKEKELHKTHESNFEIVFNGPKKDYILNIVCQNGAGDLSEMTELKFSVDYTIRGNILTLRPQDEYFQGPEINYLIETSKTASCQYEFINETNLFSTEDGRIHTATVSATEERKYSSPIKCLIGGEEVNNELSFTIDKTAPIISKIEGADDTCGSDYINLRPHSQEEKVSEYEYEVYDLSEEDIESEFSYSSYLLSVPVGELIFKNKTGPDLPMKIDLNRFGATLGKKYKVRVRIKDAAGNLGEFTDSDSFTITEFNEECGGVPEVLITTNDTSCTAKFIELNCAENSSSCRDLNYGTNVNKDSCIPDIPYNGQRIEFKGTGYVCYYAASVGKNITETVLVMVDDDDGDGVVNTCDACSGSVPGASVNQETGCSEGQFTAGELASDTDGDGLPDSWENEYNKEGCVFDSTNPDSDGNGVEDGNEDYDSDGRNNFAEFSYGTNPCIADEESKDIDEDQDQAEIDTELPLGDEEDNLLAWIFLTIGLLFVFGGFGYLIYFYVEFKKGNQHVQNKRGNGRSDFDKKSFAGSSASSMSNSWKKKFAILGRKSRGRIKNKKRNLIFSNFGKKSNEIPHITKAIKNKKFTLDDLHDLAHKYKENKENIQSGLKPEEKSVFSKLNQIAVQTKNKKIGQVVSKKEASDIFSKLKDINNKRKKK